jgi:dihydropteroate synthase
MNTRIWQCGRYAFALDRPLVMGILNVTPDSFSDGGRYLDPILALAHGRDLAANGADIIDVGGESTRPGSDGVPPTEEISRVRPVLTALARDFDVPLSIDTRHAEVARACIEAGASIINDVSGFRDPAMVELAAASDVGVIVMHMLGEPRTMQSEPVYDDVVAEVGEYLVSQAEMLEAAGVHRDRIAIDPGIGFGKTTAHNVELLRGLPDIADVGYPVVVGASRKRFIGDLTGEVDPARRVSGSVAAAAWSVLHGADVVRVHDVWETVQTFGVWTAIEGGWRD